ncbi:hypothetical protein OsI_23100 [Oryza sativa Indica Group]|uniref:Uncharacterized protein n=1 Tax=Oryza sativa subsp. indica TaxID=39946 RepID=B8B2V0_ORYSI|nr:hypothetical protein OsI_23100 [Oryza sativa Indica Group]
MALGGRAVPECLPSSSPGRHESRGGVVGELRPVRIRWQGGSSAPVGADQRAARPAASSVCCEGRGRDEPRGGAVLSPSRWCHYNLRRDQIGSASLPPTLHPRLPASLGQHVRRWWWAAAFRATTGYGI